MPQPKVYSSEKERNSIMSETSPKNIEIKSTNQPVEGQGPITGGANRPIEQGATPKPAPIDRMPEPTPAPPPKKK